MSTYKTKPDFLKRSMIFRSFVE